MFKLHSLSTQNVETNCKTAEIFMVVTIIYTKLLKLETRKFKTEIVCQSGVYILVCC